MPYHSPWSQSFDRDAHRREPGFGEASSHRDAGRVSSDRCPFATMFEPLCPLSGVTAIINHLTKTQMHLHMIAKSISFCLWWVTIIAEFSRALDSVLERRSVSCPYRWVHTIA